MGLILDRIDGFKKLIWHSLSDMKESFVILSSYIENAAPIEMKIQERPFAYEFYHQIRRRWNLKENEDLIQDYVIQPEVNKAYQKYEGIPYIPDFIIHRKHSCLSGDQIVVFEFKMAKNVSKLPADIQKLVDYRLRLNYQLAIEVLIGLEDEIEEALSKIGNHFDKMNSPKCGILAIGYDIKKQQPTDFVPFGS